jgi:HlyD family secretion protein
VGEWINSGTRIAQVDDLSNFKINARIDEFYINRIFVNQLGNFTFDGNQYELMIQKIYPEVANGTFEVDLIFTGTPPTTIKRGQTLTIKLALSDEKEALLVARGSFYQTTGGNWAYVVQGNGNSAVKRNIQLGRQNPSYYEVVDGLTPGDVVIVSSYENYGNKDILVLQN